MELLKRSAFVYAYVSVEVICLEIAFVVVGVNECWVKCICV